MAWGRVHVSRDIWEAKAFNVMPGGCVALRQVLLRILDCSVCGEFLWCFVVLADFAYCVGIVFWLLLRCALRMTFHWVFNFCSVLRCAELVVVHVI